MAKLTDEQKQEKLLKALKGSKKPLTAKQATEATGMTPDDVKIAGKALMKAGKVRFVGEKNNLLELIPVEKKAPKGGKKVSKKSSDWDEDEAEKDSDADEDEEDGPEKDSDDEDAEKDSDAEDTEDLEDLTVTITKINKKAGSMTVEDEDENEYVLVGDDEDCDVTDYEKGQEVVVSATWDDDDEEWTLTEIEEADEDGPEKDSDDEEEDEKPKVKAKPGTKAKPAPKKSSAPAKKSPAPAKKGKEFTMQFKSIDTLSEKELTKRLKVGLETAEALFDEGHKEAAELIMRVLPKVKKQIAKLDEDDD